MNPYLNADEIKEAVETIEAKIKEFKSDMSESTKKEIKAYVAAQEKTEKELKAKVEESNAKVLELGGSIEDMQNEVKELKAKSGRIRTSAQPSGDGLRNVMSNAIAAAVGECKAEIAQSMGGVLMKPKEIKAVGNIASGNLTVDNFISYLDWRPGMEPTGQFHFRNLVRTLLSVTLQSP